MIDNKEMYLKQYFKLNKISILVLTHLLGITSCHAATPLHHASSQPYAGVPPMVSVSSSSSSALPVPPASDLMGGITENPDIESQVQGKYPELRRHESMPLGAIQHAWDQAGAGAGVYDYIYNPAEVIRIRCREMMATTIVFPAWERIDHMTLGDPGAFKVETPKPHILLVQPQEFTGVDSNLTAIGASGKVYSFYLRSEGYNSRHISDLTVYVRVPKPRDISAATYGATNQPTQRANDKTKLEDYLDELSFDPSQLNFQFDMAGDSEIAPERIYSDGIRTWFDYGPGVQQKSLPAVYNVMDGVDTPINITRDGCRLVAQAVGAFTLKAGQKVVCVTPSQGKPQ